MSVPVPGPSVSLALRPFGAALPPAQPRLRGILTPPPTRSPLFRGSPGVGPKGGGPPFLPLPALYEPWEAARVLLWPVQSSCGRQRPQILLSLLPELEESLLGVKESVFLLYRGGEECCLSPFSSHPPPRPTKTVVSSTPREILSRFPGAGWGRRGPG